MGASAWAGRTGKWLATAGPAVAMAVAALAGPTRARAGDAAGPSATYPLMLLPAAGDGSPQPPAAAAAPPQQQPQQPLNLLATAGGGSPDSGVAPTDQNTPSGNNYANTPTIGETKRQNIVQPATQAIVEEAPEKPNIHGFATSSFKTAYVTPRGLVVQNEGLVWQPIIGLVIPVGDLGPVKGVAVDTGIWNSVDAAEAGVLHTGAWDEMDPFAGVSGKVGDFSLALGYTVFISPQQAYQPEHNLDLKVSYDDSAMWGKSGFAVNPYIDMWWAISGSSTVTLGRAGGTGYFEPGVVPTYTFKQIPKYPVTVTVPTYVSIGPRDYWAVNGEPGGNFGLFSTSLLGTVPLSFVPSKYGFWHADLGFTYDYLINTTLLHAGDVVSGNTNRNVVLGSIGFGVNF